eukprot:3910352-Pyramimonas_sp.AAC.1
MNAVVALHMGAANSTAPLAAGGSEKRAIVRHTARAGGQRALLSSPEVSDWSSLNGSLRLVVPKRQSPIGRP